MYRIIAIIETVTLMKIRLLCLTGFSSQATYICIYIYSAVQCYIYTRISTIYLARIPLSTIKYSMPYCNNLCIFIRMYILLNVAVPAVAAAPKAGSSLVASLGGSTRASSPWGLTCGTLAIGPRSGENPPRLSHSPLGRLPNDPVPAVAEEILQPEHQRGEQQQQ